MMGDVIDMINKVLQRQPGKRYRLIRLDSPNITEKKIRGYSFVRKEDPEVKGTILEEHLGADGIIRVGNLGVARISEKDARVHEKKIEERTERTLKAIETAYRERGEDLQKEMGAHHKDFKVIVKEED